MKIYTIGHSAHPIEQFIGLLKTNSIATLVDVRSTPYSRFHPQFNRRNLAQDLPEHGIEYIYMGDTLGGRPSDPTCYIHQVIPAKAKDYAQEISYPEVIKRPWFTQGIDRLLGIASKQPTCFMCSEADPLQCHRQHLIAEYIRDHYPNVTVLHILRDGGLIDAGASVHPVLFK